MSSEIRLIPFTEEGLNDQIETVGEEVAIRRLCENVGVAYEPQYRKIRAANWASITMKVMDLPDGRRMEMACISWRDVPYWLATIDPKKVKSSAKPKLLIYQKRVRDVLARAFLPTTFQHPAAKQPTWSGVSINTDLERAGVLIQILVEHQQSLIAHAQDMERVNIKIQTVETSIQDIRGDIAGMAPTVKQIEQAQEYLNQVPRSGLIAEPQSIRAKINELVRAFCRAYSLAYQEVWGRGYKAFYYQYHRDVKAIFRHDEAKAERDPGYVRRYVNKLDVVEELGMLNEMFAIMTEICKPKSQLA